MYDRAVRNYGNYYNIPEGNANLAKVGSPQRISRDGQNGNQVKLAKYLLAIKKIKFNGVGKIKKLP